MGSIIVEMDARMAAHEDFDLGTKANPYQKKSAVWCSYEAEYQALVANGLEGVPNGPKQA